MISKFYLICLFIILVLAPGVSHSTSATEVLADRMIGQAMRALEAGRISEAIEASEKAFFLAGRDDDERILLECVNRARKRVVQMEREAEDARRAGDADGATHIETVIMTLKRSLGGA